MKYPQNYLLLLSGRRPSGRPVRRAGRAAEQDARCAPAAADLCRAV